MIFFAGLFSIFEVVVSARTYGMAIDPSISDDADDVDGPLSKLKSDDVVDVPTICPTENEKTIKICQIYTQMHTEAI